MEENREKSYAIGLSSDFLDMTPKSISNKSKETNGTNSDTRYTSMNLEDIMVSVISERQKDKYIL